MRVIVKLNDDHHDHHDHDHHHHHHHHDHHHHHLNHDHYVIFKTRAAVFYRDLKSRGAAGIAVTGICKYYEIVRPQKGHNRVHPV